MLRRVDGGIAREYPAYRAAHHDLVLTFWNDWVIGAKYAR
jgi:hypothetical protein